MSNRVAGVLALVAGLGFAGPLAAQTPDQAPAQPQAQQAGRPGLESWLADRKSFRVGDAISVLVDEYTLASSDKSEVAVDDKDRRLAAGVDISGMDLPITDGGFSTTNRASSRQRGEASRRDRLAGEITVRVVEVAPDGMLRVEGTKAVSVNDREQTLAVAGWLRPEDVSAQNIVESWRLADATIGYETDGDLGKAKGGILGRLLGWLWP